MKHLFFFLLSCFTPLFHHVYSLLSVSTLQLNLCSSSMSIENMNSIHEIVSLLFSCSLATTRVNIYMDETDNDDSISVGQPAGFRLWLRLDNRHAGMNWTGLQLFSYSLYGIYWFLFFLNKVCLCVVGNFVPSKATAWGSLGTDRDIKGRIGGERSWQEKWKAHKKRCPGNKWLKEDPKREKRAFCRIFCWEKGFIVHNDLDHNFQVEIRVTTPIHIRTDSHFNMSFTSHWKEGGKEKKVVLMQSPSKTAPKKEREGLSRQNS